MRRSRLLLLVAVVLSGQPIDAAPLWEEARRSLAAPEFNTHFEKIFDAVNPAVVNISTLQSTSAKAGVGNRKNLGSGFVFHPDGFIVTNHHVVQGEHGIAVTTATGKNYLAKRVGSDPYTDIAVIKIEAGQRLPTVALGDSDRSRVGHWVLAIGNPFGFRNTMTHGILSARGRVISSEQERKRFDDFLQVDAAINPGNSGGPLVNMEGDVVGVNTATTATGGGIAFAVPINLVKTVLQQLVTVGRVERGWVGIVAQERELLIESERSDSTNAPNNMSLGLLVLEVVPQSPAHKGGVRKGDRLVAVNHQSIESLQQLSERFSTAKPGSELVLSLQRNHKPITIVIKVESLSVTEKLK